MEFRLLGPVEVCAGEAALPIGGAKPRTLLAALLLESGRVLSNERLVDIIWDDDPPDTARALIQTYVSALRRATHGWGAEVIETRPPGYLVNVPDGSLDRQAFDVLVSQGRAAVAAGRSREGADAFRAAGALWRGPALGGVTGRTLAAEAARLDEARIAVLEERIAADLALGRWDELTGELTVLVGQHPTRERLRGQLMLALYGSGRAADALAVYRDGRAALIEELGIEPGPELTRLHEAILRGDPDLLPQPARQVPPVAQPRPAPEPRIGGRAVPAQLPPNPPDFTGRTEEIERLAEVLTRPATGTTVCVVAGPGGAGKSALAVRVAHRIATRFPDGQLHVDLRGMTGSPADPGEVLGRLCRALDPDGATRLPDAVDERMDRYRTLLACRRLLVILDDAASEHQVRPLLPGGAGCTVLVTARNRLPGLAGAHLVELDMLSPEEARTLLARVAGTGRIDGAPEAAAQIAARCGYLPLAVRIAGARLAARRHWSPQLLATRLADEQRRLDELAVGDQQIRATIEMSYRGLDEPARLALRRLGRLGLPDFPAWVVAALVDLPEAPAERVVERLVDAHLVDYSYVDGAGQVRYRLHDLVRLYAREQAQRHETPAEDVAATSRVVSGWLWLVEQLAQRLSPGTIHHHPRRSPARLAYPAVAELALAGPRAWLDVEQHALVLTVERAAALDLDELAVELAATLSSSLDRTHNLRDSWGRIHDAALAAARRAGNAEGEAILLAELGSLRYDQDRFAEAREYLSHALAMFRDAGDARGAAVALTALGTACREQGYLPEALHFLGCAETECRALRADTAIGHCLRIRGSVHLEQGDYAAVDADLAEALAAYRRTGGRRGEAMTLRTIALAHRARGELDAAEDACATALAMFEEIGDSLLTAYCLRTLAKTRMRKGDLDWAADALRRALETCHAAGDRWGEAVTRRTIGELHLAAGRLDDADQHFAAALRGFDALDIRLFRARTLRDVARVRQARGDTAAAAAAQAEALEIFRQHHAREYRELTAVSELWRSY
jgi:DNA-binding SARP family transcriptional activator/tetratricopeptide (TPR) repeat protein